ncbi:MAG: hypothetical protein ABR548_06350 [Actinomycetota bacterium]|nr:hypothetical protein [Actinomycetota bacterium]
MTTGVNKGVAWYEHIVKSSLTEFSVYVDGGWAWTNKLLGYMRAEDPQVCSAWTGYHVHEMNNISSTWDAWNTATYNNADGTFHEVDNILKWTRELAYSI